MPGESSGSPLSPLRRPDRKPAGPASPTPWRVEGERTGSPTPGTQGAPGSDGKSPQQNSWTRMLVRFGPFLLLAILVANWVTMSSLVGHKTSTTVYYSFFHSQLADGNVSSVTNSGSSLTGTFRTAVDFTPTSGKTTTVTDFTTQLPTFNDPTLPVLLLKEHVTLDVTPPTSTPLWQQILFGFGPTLLFVGLLFWLMRRTASGLGGMGGFGRSRAKLYSPEANNRTTFADVAGIDEVQAEVMEIVDFLREPERFRRLGATIPRGVLLSGPPGTGKTLLARAVAGEADVPFFSISAAEFIEMIVGVGASRVRDLFDQAKKAAPAIIFIDELDAIGRARGGANSLGGHDEREQTLNQILTEMDGFTGSEGVVVLAATNRTEVLDPALLRPGRFDRRVIVSPPDQAGRAKILEVHTRSVPLGSDVDLQAIASSTPGMVGADLRNLVNEAALLAARRDHRQVMAADFTDALEKVVLGAERKIVMAPEEKERTAYHESGHALLGMLTPGADPVRKISIIPRGMALGVTMQSPENDRYGYSSTYLKGRITGALGGRAAEELIFGDTTTGAESDLETATRIARQMVGRWGMSAAIGPVSVLPGPGRESMFGMDPDSPSPDTRERVDAEVRRILEECYQDALDTLREHQDKLVSLSAELLRVETLDEADAYQAAGVPRPSAPNVHASAEHVGAAAETVVLAKPAPPTPPAPADPS